MLRCVVWLEVTDVSAVLTATIRVKWIFYHTTIRNIPEDSHLQTRRLENMKARFVFVFRQYSGSCLILFICSLTTLFQ